MANDFISELRAVANRAGTQTPVGNLIQNLDVAAVLSKVVKPRDMGRQEVMSAESESFGVNTGVDKVSKSIMQRLEDNENIYQLFPDIELAIQIIVSSIMSPKDMVKSELIYRTEDSDLPPAVLIELTDIVREEINKHYKLKDELPVIIRDALFDKGSHVKAVIPESAVDELINSGQRITTESMYSTDIFYAPLENAAERKIVHLGILGDPRPIQSKGAAGRTMAMEAALNHTASTSYNPALYVGDYSGQKDDFIQLDKFTQLISESIEVTDNFRLLKLPELFKRINAQKLENLMATPLPRTLTPTAAGVALENYATFTTDKRPTPKELSTLLYKSPKEDYSPMRMVPEAESLKRKSVGRPLCLDVPSEAAIPIHVPGKPTEHIGYFFPIDIDGNFVTLDSTPGDTGQGLSSLVQSDKSGYNASALLTEKARQNIVGSTAVPMIEHMSDLYAEIIEKDMLTRLARGSYGRTFDVARNNEIYRIMLVRSLQAKFTRLLYVPAEYVTYFAFNYHRNGVGRSYLDKLSNITSLRAMVVFSKVMAAVKSSIETTHVNVTLDPRDGDPVKTIEMAKHFVARSRQQYFPHGLNRVADLTDWIQRAGIQMTYEGHPRLPTTKFDFESKNIAHVPPDESLEELFRKQSYMHFGISPDVMDTAVGSDFATSVEKNSVLFTKRIMVLSDQLSVKMSEYVAKIILMDQTLQERMVEVLEKNKADIEARMTDDEKALYTSDPALFTRELLRAFSKALVVDIPKPETIKTTSQKEAIENYEQLLDKTLSFIFSEELLPQELGGDAAQYTAALKAAWKGALMRQWLADNNVTPEVFKITDTTEDGKAMVDLLELTTDYTKALMLNINSFLAMMKDTKAASNEDVQAINPGESSGGSSSSSYSSGDYSSDGGEGGEGEGGGEASPFDDIANDMSGGEEGEESGNSGDEGGEKNPFNAIADEASAGPEAS